MIATRWSDLQARHPRIRWAAKWGLSLLSLASGILTLSLFRRGLEYFAWVVGYLLLLWLAGVVFAQARDALEAHGRRLVRVAYDYTVQSLYWHLLLFLLPIYYVSTTITSRNVVFFLILGAATLLTAVDPWYRATVLGRPWAAALLFGFTLFATLKVALALVGLESAWSLICAAAISMLALAPVVRRSFGIAWRWAGMAAGMAALGLALVIWFGRAWIPPAPLVLVLGTFAREVRNLEPVEPITRVSAEDVQGWGALACFTALAAPAGLREPIVHVWKRDDAIVARVPLAPVRGGRPGGFRTYSRLTTLGAEPAGRWQVDVLTAHGQLIGRVRLAVHGS